MSKNKDTIKVTIYLLDGTSETFYADEYCKNGEEYMYWHSSEKNEYYSYPYTIVKKFIETDTDPESE